MIPFITTYTGRRINPLNVRPEDICIEDIAHALACCNRFAGHATRPISVGQHSVYVSRVAGRHSAHDALQGLLHDASEAYLGDVTRFLKATPEMSAYRLVEYEIEKTVYRKFGLSVSMTAPVRDADNLLVRFELGKAFGPSYVFDVPGFPKITPEERKLIGKWTWWSWKTAEEVFLAEFRGLIQQRERR